MLSSVGGNSPQALMHDACRAIGRGDLDVVLVTGAEALYTRALSRRDPSKTPLTWSTQPDDTPEPVSFGTDKFGSSELELRRGLLLPVHAYPLFENALRAALGLSLAEHAARIGALWSRFSEVAAGNPNAWIRTPRTPDEIVTPGPDNRMITFPYPKLCTANLQVDQAAAYIVCSAEAAAAAGVPEDRWVFPISGADANDHWYVSDRPELHRSPAIRLAGAAALELAGIGVDDLAAVDLYSCFPAVVQMAAAELGLPLEDPGRPLTLTGGLTFAGGPGNNYTSHGIARCVEALRAAPGSLGLVSGLGWYSTKHALGVYASRPPGRGGNFAWRDVQPEVDCVAALPRRCRRQRAGAGRDVHRHLRPRGFARARDRGLPHSGRHQGLGQRDRFGHLGADVRRGGDRPHRDPGARRRRSPCRAREPSAAIGPSDRKPRDGEPSDGENPGGDVPGRTGAEDPAPGPRSFVRRLSVRAGARRHRQLRTAFTRKVVA